MNRRNIEYKLRHVLKYYLCCRHYKKLDALKKSKDKRHLYLNRAGRKLRDDMDIVSLIRME